MILVYPRATKLCSCKLSTGTNKVLLCSASVSVRNVVGWWECLPFYKEKDATYTATLLLRMSYCYNYSCKWRGMLPVNSNYTEYCLASIASVCVCVCGIVMWTKMVGRRQCGYCGIAQHLAASTETGDKIHSYNAILRGDSSLIVTIQISCQSVRKQIVYKSVNPWSARVDKVQDGRRLPSTYVDLDGRSSIGCRPSTDVDVAIGGNNCDSWP